MQAEIQHDTQSYGEYYAAVDLGSNSFHMVIVHVVNGSVQIIGKIKQKVRLAAGLDDELALDDVSMERGWQCLQVFSERLQDIPPSNIKIVATATLRLATNAHVFIRKAEEILKKRNVDFVLRPSRMLHSLEALVDSNYSESVNPFYSRQSAGQLQLSPAWYSTPAHLLGDWGDPDGPEGARAPFRFLRLVYVSSLGDLLVQRLRSPSTFSAMSAQFWLKIVLFVEGF